MTYYISETPMIAVLPPSSQRDRLDTFFYHHQFSDLDDKLKKASERLITVEQASTLITDGTHQTPTYTEKEKGVLFLSSTNITEKGIDLTDCKYITHELHNNLKNCQPQLGDVLIAKSGTVGIASVFSKDLPECSVYESVAILRTKTKWIPEFVACFINSDLGTRQIKRSQKGIAIKHLHLGDLKELLLPEVSENAQKNIVSRFNILAELHTEIIITCHMLQDIEHEISLKRIDKEFSNEASLESFVPPRNQKIFLRNSNLAERFDVQANHPDYTHLIDQIKRSPTAGTLVDLVNVSEDRFDPDNYRGKEVYYLAIGDIDGISGKIISSQVGLAEEMPSQMRLLAKENDIVVGVTGASTGTDNMVVFIVRKEHENHVFSSDMKILRPKKSVNPEYIQRLLKAPFVLRQISHLMYGAAMKRISLQDLLNISIPITNENTRKQTLEKIEKIISEEQELISLLDSISKQIDQLLSQAKSNIFDLLDDSKYSAMSTKAYELKEIMIRIEESLK